MELNNSVEDFIFWRVSVVCCVSNLKDGIIDDIFYNLTKKIKLEG